MKQRWAIAFIVFCGCAMAAVVRWQEQSALAAALDSYRQESTEHARATARDVRAQLTAIYSGLRTMARLPGVRAIDRYGTNFSSDARTTVQEIYNNLASTVSMSEVYIVPLDFDPDTIDPATGALETPITTFDELIVGQTLTARRDPDTAPGAVEYKQHADHLDARGVPEIEIFEYRLMRHQLAELVRDFPDEGSIKALAYPSVAGPEVVTCDNSRYDPTHPRDEDRSGLVLSVPFYGLDGRLKGMISGVLLTQALRERLRGSDYALHAARHGFVAGSLEDGPWRRARDDILADRPASNLLYSEAIPLALPDRYSRWTLWAGQDDEQFWTRSDVRAAHAVAAAGYVITLLVTVLAALWLRSLHQRRRHIEAQNALLEQTVDERTRALRGALDVAEAATRAKSQFLANMSHEIRTPINGVLGMNEILLHTELDDHQLHCAHTIRNSGRALLDVINDVLDFSKMEAGMLTLAQEPFDLREVVEEVAGLLAEGAAAKGLRLYVDIAPALACACRGDASRVRQVLVNLLGNAIKFTADGEVVVSADADAHGECLRVSVRDSGIGIAEADQARIFEAFAQADGGTTRRFGGTGLGLSISTQLCRLMGGDIGVVSEPGRGAEFWFTVRRADVPHAAAVGDDRPLRGTHVLVVDDDPRDRALLVRQLEHWGATVDAVAWLADVDTRGAARPPRIAIVACPAGSSAAALTTLAQRLDGADDRPALLLTAHLRALPALAAARPAGIDGFIVKPLRSAEIRRALATLRQDGPGAGTTPATNTPATARFCGRVLVAEDNLVNQEVVRALLEMAGLDVDTVGDGAAAAAAIGEHPYDLVFMDCQMPVMSGYEATAAVRARERSTGCARTTIVALTANSLMGDREACLAAGMDDYLAKPFSDEQLRDMLARRLATAPDANAQAAPADVVTSAPPRRATAMPSPRGPAQPAGDATPAWTPTSSAEAAPTRDATPAEDTAPQTMNPVALAQLEARERGGRGGLLKRVIGGYLQQSPTHLHAFEAAAAGGDLAAVVFAAHALKSSSATIGAEQLAVLCRAAETHGRNGDHAAAVADLVTIREQHDAVCTYLRTRFPAQAA